MNPREGDPPPYSDGLSSISQPQEGKGFKLNSEQMQWLLKRISSEDQEKLTEQLKACTTEMTLGRAMPFALGVMGAMYYARQKLPQKFHFGPKGPWFYAIIGFTSLTAANFLSMSTCADRIRPLVNDFWVKYSDEKNISGTTYDMLRQRNRANLGAQGNVADTDASASSSADYPSMLKGVPVTGTSSPAFLYDKESSYISGTPTTGQSRMQQENGKSNQYGDVDFS